MRYANVLVLLGVLALTAEATRRTPCYIEVFVRGADDPQQRQTLRKTCRHTLDRHRSLYGDRPAEEWPSQRAKLIHANAERILAELEETKP